MGRSGGLVPRGIDVGAGPAFHPQRPPARSAVASLRVGRCRRYVGLHRRLVPQPVVGERVDGGAQPLCRGLAARPPAHHRRWDAAMPVGRRGAGVAGGAVPPRGPDRASAAQVGWLCRSDAGAPASGGDPPVERVSGRPGHLAARVVGHGAGTRRCRAALPAVRRRPHHAAVGGLRVRVGPGSCRLRWDQRLPG